MKEIIEKLLEEVDVDLKELMLKVDGQGNIYWQLLPDPTGTVLRWQELRDRKIEYEDQE